MINSELKLGIIELIPVALDDAEFIVELRADAVNKGFLKRGADNAEAQRAWLRRYFERQYQDFDLYFVVAVRGRKCGTLRVSKLDPTSDAFTWGSWCLISGLNPQVAVASCLLAYDAGFSIVGKKHAIFEVHQENVGVLAFHRRMGACETGVRNMDQLEFKMTRDAYNLCRSRWVKWLERAPL